MEERRLAFRIGGKGLMEMCASHMMKREVVFFGKEAYCNVLAASMVKGGFGSVPIISHAKKLIGLVSEYVILNALMAGEYLRETPASAVMTKSVVSIKEETPMMAVIGLLQARHLIRVPVVDDEGRLIGIVARRDLLECHFGSTLGPLPSF